MIKRITLMAIADIKNIRHDPMLALALLGPFMLIFIYCTGLPMFMDILWSQFSLSLFPYTKLIFYVFLLMLPVLIGMIAGFFMLEERDMQIISYISVTPFGKKGYLYYRLLSPFVITVLSLVIFLELSGIAVPFIWKIVIIVIVALLAPLFALFLVAFATNRVEGLALSKSSSFLLLAPFVIHFAPEKIQWVVSVLPTFWTVKVIDEITAGTHALLYFIVALLFHFVLLFILYKKFDRGIC